MNSLDRFLSRMERARDDLRRSELREAVVLHHDEADGLTSAALAKFIDPRLSKFAHLATVGAYEIPGELRGLNMIAVRDALEQGLVKVSRDDYKIEVEGMRYSRSRLSSALNVLGSVGYYRDGPTIGVASCINGMTESTFEFARKLEEERKEANKRMLSTINREGLQKKRMLQWFHAQDNYAGMSGKVVGSFCSYLKFQRQVDPSKYLIGMMNVPPDIPGWGSLPSQLVKVSGRTPRVLSDQIKRGERPALSRILSQACLTAGGFGDGHAVATSGAFPIGKEELFLSEMDRMASSK